MPAAYGSYATPSAERAERDDSSSAADDAARHAEDESRRRLLGETPRDRMTLLEVLYAYDLTLAQLAYQRFGRAPAARVAWEVLSHLGDGILWFLMVLPVIAVMWLLGLLENVSPASKMVFFAFYTCNFVDIVAIIILKIMFKRQRPPHHQTDGRFVGPDQHSFPSGHATRVWCIVALMFDLSARHASVVREFFRMSPDALRVLIVLWAIAISFSRIALGRHYPSDVVAGAFIGVGLLYPIAHVIIRHLGVVEQY